MSGEKSNRVLAFIKGRSDRKQYWVAVVLLAVGNIVLAGLQTPALIVSAISMPLWLVTRAAACTISTEDGSGP